MKRIISLMLAVLLLTGLLAAPGLAAELPAEDDASGPMTLDGGILALSKAARIDMTPALQEALTDMIRVDPANTAAFSVQVMLSTDGGTTWQEATPETMPGVGIYLYLPYPEGTSREGNDFTVIWAEPEGGYSSVIPQKAADKLTLKITRLDDLCLVWTKAADAPDEPDPQETPLPEPPSDALGSGTLEGTQLAWYVDAAGVLTVNGSGDMPDFRESTDGDALTVDTPWFGLRDKIVKVVVGSGVTGIGNYAFRSLTEVTEAVLPDGLTKLGDASFSGCIKLASLDLPSTLVSIGDRAFAWCPFKSIAFPAGLKSIGAGCFGMNELETLVLPEGLESVGPEAFSPNERITELTIPASLRRMETTDGTDGPFTGLYALETVHVSEGVTEIPGRCFSHCFALKTIELPSTIRTLGHDFVLLESGGESSPAKLETITVAPREGYVFGGWEDEEGQVLTSEEIVAGKRYDGDLKAVWTRSFDKDTFTDVNENNWFYEDVAYVYRMGMMVGTSDTAFEPAGTGTRAQVVTILYRMAGEPIPIRANPFTDVPEGQWYTNAVIWAAENGVTNGYGDGTFRPNQPVTRQEFVKFLQNMAAYLGITDPDDKWEDSYTESFPDAGSISDWARPAENWSVGVGLQRGSADAEGKLWLNPLQSVTRAELAAFLKNFRTGLADIAKKSSAHKPANSMTMSEAAEALAGKDAAEFVKLFGEPESKSYQEGTDAEGWPHSYGRWNYGTYSLYTDKYNKRDRPLETVEIIRYLHVNEE